MLSDRIGGLIGIGFGGLALAEAIRLYPMRTTIFNGDHTLPGFVGGLFIILGLLLLFSKGQKFKVEFPDRKIMVGMLVAFGLLIGYWFSLEYLGYIISTFFVSIGLFRIVGSFDYGKSTIFSTLLTVTLYLIFIFWLAMPFPTGILDI